MWAGVVATSCAKNFDGPYDCLPGYASCVNPRENLCETELDDDGLNCGSCGNVCPLGAACSGSACGAAATTLTTIPALGGSQDSQITIAGGSLFLAANGENGIGSIPTNGGTLVPLVQNDAQICGPGSFAVDTDHLYYWSNGFNGGDGGLTQLSLTDSSRTVLVPNANSKSSSNNGCGAVAVDASNVYWLSSEQNCGGNCAATLSEIPKGGGTQTTLGTVQTGNDRLVINSSSAIFQLSESNGPERFEVLPLDGSASSQIAVTVNTEGSSAFAADDANIYVLGSGCGCCNCSDNSNQDNHPPTGTIAKIPLDGGPQTILAQFSGESGAIALGANDVYWSTDTAVWKVPIAGGPAVPVAGNLTAGTPAFTCTGACGSGSNGAPNALAVDATSVYVADTNGSVNALLKVSN